MTTVADVLVEGEAPLSLEDALLVVADLNDKRIERNRRLDVLMAYYRGEQPLPEAPAKAREAYRRLAKQSISNWMRLVVDAAAERLKIDGFRTSDSEDADKTAWEWWQHNSLDSASSMVHTEAMKCGIAYVMVWPSDAGVPRITGEHPSQVFVQVDPEDAHRGVRAIKVWLDVDKRTNVTLYTPNFLYRFRSEAENADPRGPLDFALSGWVQRIEDGDNGWPVANPTGEVPFIPFYNNPDLLGQYQSDIEPVLPIQDRINATIFNRLLAAEFSAFRQRWVTGMDVPIDPETGKAVEPFNAAVDRLWVFGDETTRVGEFSEASLGNYISSVESDVQHLAAITRTPPHYLLGQSGAFPSGESLKSTETGLMARVAEKQVQFGEAWERVMRLAGRIAGNAARAEDVAAEVIWRNTESRTLGELTDSLLKLQTLGVPNVVLWERYGFTPTEIERMKEEAEAQDALKQMAAAMALRSNVGEAPPGEQPADEPPADEGP